MKRLVVLALFFTACGSNESKTKAKIEEDSTNTSVVTLVADTANTSNTTVGTPKKLGNLEIAGNSLPGPMTWDQAKTSCEALGKGWRLPTVEELNTMFKAKDSLGNFTTDLYWSSEELDTLNARVMNFSNGKQSKFSKIYEANARAVRSL